MIRSSRPIDRHNAAIAALENINEDNEPYAEALQELADAHDALMDTVPLTIAGCRALVEHMIDLGAGEVDGGQQSAPHHRRPQGTARPSRATPRPARLLELLGGLGAAKFPVAARILGTRTRL